jgi:ankyrin repeat protein/L-ascorbate metabolism protein UlaG (beta-lactamase superfamily)
MKDKKVIKGNFKAIILAAIAAFSLTTAGWSQCNKKVVDDKPIAETIAGLIWNSENEKIQQLVDENNDLVNIRLDNEETMLTIAAWKGNYELAKYLISKKANLNSRNYWENTPLHNASLQGFDNIITLLLDNGAVLNAKGTDGNTSLCFAAEKGHTSTVKLLLEKGATVDAVNDWDQTPLMTASWGGNAELMGALIDKGAKVNITTPGGNTILQNLTYNGSVESIELVLKSGADISKANSEGKTALHMAVMNKRPEIVGILAPKMKDINVQENILGNTPLHIAAINGDLQSTEILLKAGAKANILNNSNKTAVDYAIRYGYPEVVSLFMTNGLATKEAVNAAKTNKAAGVVMVNNGEAKVTYCGHSGWAVQTEKYLLVFDYWKSNGIKDIGLAGGSINPDEIRNKEVIVFVSHDHNDHYDTVIYDWKDKVKNITYVYGFKPEDSWIYKDKGYHGPEYVYINDNQTKQLGDVVITTVKSNDSGQGFLVSANGITIYHPGDLAWFSAEDEPVFKKEVDFLADKSSKVDIAFLPVTGCPSRWKKEFIVDGFFYSIDKLNPVQVFPMHASQREYTLKEFAELAKERMVKSQVVCSEFSGDSYQYTKTMVASK